MNDFIEIYDNSAPQELCDELVKWFDICSDKGFTVHNMPFSSGETKSSFRTDESMTVPGGIKDDHYPVSSDTLPGKICDAFWDVLNSCLKEYFAKYDMGSIQLSCYNFKIHKVKKGQGYHIWHFENYHKGYSCRRALAWMTYLKVPEEGGETEFLYQSKRIEPIVGRTLIWPAYFTHLHRGNPPLKGEKYYITGWIERE